MCSRRWAPCGRDNTVDDEVAVGYWWQSNWPFCRINSATWSSLKQRRSTLMQMISTRRLVWANDVGLYDWQFLKFSFWLLSFFMRVISRLAFFLSWESYGIGERFVVLASMHHGNSGECERRGGFDCVTLSCVAVPLNSVTYPCRSVLEFDNFLHFVEVLFFLGYCLARGVGVTIRFYTRRGFCFRLFVFDYLG